MKYKDLPELNKYDQIIVVYKNRSKGNIEGMKETWDYRCYVDNSKTEITVCQTVFVDKDGKMDEANPEPIKLRSIDRILKGYF